ncbi:MAG: hypothetical protein CMA72_06840 [Euryarchaeota archaeon]|nr:hypothetical protein [Euryarchaeota archaeon]
MDAIKLLVEKRTRAGNDVVSSYPGRPRDDLRLKKPKEIFRKLGISGASKKNTATEAVGDLIQTARKEQAFRNAFGPPIGVLDNNGIKGIFVPIGNIDIKSMTQYLALFLIAAFDGGFIRNIDDVRVQHETTGRGVIVYATKGGKSRWSGKAVPAKTTEQTDKNE